MLIRLTIAVNWFAAGIAIPTLFLQPSTITWIFIVSNILFGVINLSKVTEITDEHS